MGFSFVLILAFVGLGICLVLYALLPAEKVVVKKAKQAAYNFKKEQPLEGAPKESGIDYLISEFDKLKAEYSILVHKLEASKKKEEELIEALEKREEWISRDEAALSELQKEKLNLEKALKTKEEELSNEFNKSVDLSRQIRDLNLKYELLEKDNKEKTEMLELFKHKAEAYLREIKNREEEIKVLQDAIAQFKKKEEESEWVSKKEFNKLNEEYARLKNEYDTSEQKLKLKEEKIKELNLQVEQLTKTVNRLSGTNP